MDHKDINGREIASKILDDVRENSVVLSESGWAPRLISIMIGDIQEVHLYVRNQRRQADRCGVLFEERLFDANVTQAEILAAIESMNVDPRITGIILQRPIPQHLSIKVLQEAVHPLKDVEGMHPASIGRIVYNETELGPCTAIAAIEMLRATGQKLEGLEVTVIGHSEIVGKPIAFLLMAEGATVTVCHHMTRSIAVHARSADALFVAVGKPGLITGDMIKPGSVVVDIGINQIENADGTTSVVGDADYESCSKIAGWITPVPGGVGPVTVSILMRNAITATRRQKAHYEALLGQSTVTIT